jgi:NTE family protein
MPGITRMDSWLKLNLKSAERFSRVVFFAIFFCIQNFFSALGQSVDSRPAIGLALSGGGSCGLAHIGVLKVMEEAGLRPDFITGVSMGSIIGGLYSIGYSADSLEKIMKNIDWNLIMSNKIPETKIIYQEKKHFYNSILTLPVTLKKSMFPLGLNNGQQMASMLNFYTWPAAKIDDFSKLPIPFMCLATNLVKCTKVELRKGYLADAMRASAALPTIFTPLKTDSVPLIDGGFIRNFAVSELREMGADIVIGSYTGSHMTEKEELQTITDVLAQLLFFEGVYDFDRQKKLVDILIEPKTEDIQSTSFANLDTIIKRGYAAAAPYKTRFKKLADSLNQIEVQRPPQYILDRQNYSFDRIVINGNKRISKSQIIGILNIKSHQQINKYQIKEKIELLYGKSWFDKVKYRIVPENDSLILVIDCVETPEITLYGSIHYDNALHSGLVLGLSIKNPLIQRSLMNIDTYIGHYYMAELDYSQFIDRSQKYSLTANFYFDNTYIPRMELYGETGGTFNRNFEQSISFKKRFGLNHMLDFSVQYENRYLVPDYISVNKLIELNHNFLSKSAEYNVNTLNAKHFPKKGLVAHLSVGTTQITSGKIKTDSNSVFFKYNDSGINTFKRFLTVNGNYKIYFPLSGRWTICTNGEILYVSDSDTVSSQNNFFFLGGSESISKRSIPMIGFHPYQIPVRKLAGIGLNVDFEIIDNVHLEFMSNIFANEEIENINKISLLAGFGLGAGYMSIFGPLKAGLMYGLYDREKYFFSRLKGYISLGYRF